MLENLDELIELNLKLLNESFNHKMYKQSFKSLENKKHLDKGWLASILQEKDLITRNGDNCLLTENGKLIFEKGGWKKYIESENLKIEKAEAKDVLEFENLKLQKEASEYQKSIRTKEEQIRNLTTDNLRLGNWDIRFRWYIAVGGFIFGFIIEYFIDN